MGDQPETLHALAACEVILGDRSRELEQLPGLIEAAEHQAVEARAKVTSEHERLAELERTGRDWEAELQDCESRRDRFRSQTAQVKTNVEYTALLHEIDGVTQRISELEEEILGAMEEADERREGLVSLEREQGDLERQLQERAKGLRERLEQVRQEIQDREAERETWLQSLKPETQTHYRRVVQAQRTAIARLRGRICSACYRDIPYETVNRVLAGEIHTCLSCHRILIGEEG
jgi:predicted  nucleic acid-binding Zn-ribbon protein